MTNPGAKAQDPASTTAGNHKPHSLAQSPRAGQGEASPGETADAGLARRAQRLAEAGKTLEDILNSVVETNRVGDSEAIREVDEIIGQGDLVKTIERMSGIEHMLHEKRARDAGVAAGFAADNLEVAARRLDQIYRTIVTPRIEQMRRLEGKAARLAEGLQQLSSNQKITIWHGSAIEFLDELDQAMVAHEASNELHEAMQQEGWDQRTNGSKWNWKRREDANFLAPQRYGQALGAILEELQQQTQELILTDLATSEEMAIPVQYRRLVERYIQVLSSDLRQSE